MDQFHQITGKLQKGRLLFEKVDSLLSFCMMANRLRSYSNFFSLPVRDLYLATVHCRLFMNPAPGLLLCLYKICMKVFLRMKWPISSFAAADSQLLRSTTRKTWPSMSKLVYINFLSTIYKNTIYGKVKPFIAYQHLLCKIFSFRSSH